MQISFQVSAKSMYSQINSGNEALFFGLYFDDISRDGSNFIDEVPIVPKNVPKHIGHGKSDVLPPCPGQSVECILHPDVSGLFAAGSTESTFA
jgi:hypothetical protein